MDKEEVICISSDDEVDATKNSEKQNTLPSEESNDALLHVKEEVLLNENESMMHERKRKLSNADESTAKRTKPDSTEMKEKNRSTADKENDEISSSSESEMSNCSSSLSKQQNNKTTPKLIVKEKRSVPQVEQDVFPMFISLCLQKDRSEDMQTIVNKLKRRYEQLDPAYARSRRFAQFLNEKRNAIISSNKQLYIHIADVMNEMKIRRKKTQSNAEMTYEQDTETDAASASVSNSHNKKEGNVCDEEYDEESNIKDQRVRKQIREIRNAMALCEKKIRKLEEAEVDFDDENDSTYIKLERYKQRMVELYNMYCELTGENADAGRPYLRPKYLSTTNIPSVDQAITSFINSKILKRKKTKKLGAFTNSLIFPDYTDILQCVTRCNDLHNLGLDKKKQQQIAKKAFTELGEYLQRARRNDYWDTFSLFLENKEDDPAVKDSNLAEKLKENHEKGEKKLSEVFETYVKKQEEMKDRLFDDKTASDDDDDEQEDNSNDEEDKDEDEVGSISLDEDESSLKEKESDKEDITVLDDDNISMEGDENDKDHNQNADDKSDNDIQIEEDINMDTKKSCTDSKSEAEKPNDTRISSTVNDKTDSKSESEILEVTPSTVSTDNTERTEEHEADTVSTVSESDVPVEESKPLLRLRSFAKPPTTWEDGKQPSNKSTAEGNDSKVSENNVIDLTNDTEPDTNVCRRATVRLPPNVIPVTRGKYKVIVPTNNIIKVKNITNNYVKLNPQISSTVSNVPAGHIVTSKSGERNKQQVERNKQKPTTIISTDQQTAGITVHSSKQTKTILRIVPTRTIIVPVQRVEKKAAEPVRTTTESK